MDFTNREKKASAGFAQKLKVGFVAVATLLGGGLGTSACLDRPLCDKDCRPRTTNIFVEAVTQKAVDKIDLLFMIDNSISMADKQAVLKEAVPDLVQRLVSPNCVNTDGQRGTTPADPGTDCESGYAREFNPIKNIHVGVITSSLGDHGAKSVCFSEDTKGTALEAEEKDDKGHLIASRPRFAAELASYTGAKQQPEAQGFLDWNPPQRGGSQDIAAFKTTFQAMVTAADEFGCGYEAQLEAVHRFLTDPKPYQSIQTASCPGSSLPCAYPTGVDTDLLEQRKAFLRPDSLVAVIMVTDENDCSIQDTQQAYYAARQDWRMSRSVSICNTNPNDKCCVACSSPTPDGCQKDPACDADLGRGAGNTPEEADKANLRCFNQKKRFGIDFLYPTDRYVNALSQSQLCTSRANLAVNPSNPNDCPDGDNDGQPDLYANPLFSDLTGSGSLPRDKGNVFFAGIVGVPYQDLQTSKRAEANKPDYPADELHFQVAKQLNELDTWAKILGDPNPGNGVAPVPPTNTLMIESIEPRDANGTALDGQGNPLAGVNGARLQNPVNSHEWNSGSDDLQYACVFPLAAPRDCAAVSQLPKPQPGCDCKNANSGVNNPLCQDPNGVYGANQYFAKAYPGLRELQVLKDFGNNSIVASICARNLEDDTKQDYGYRPAVDAIVDRLKEALTGRCLPRRLKADPATGKIPCSIIEVRPSAAAQGQCDSTRRREAASPEAVSAAKARLREAGTCGVGTQPSCDAFTFCTILESDKVGANGPECHTTSAITEPGWCYWDPETQPADDPSLVDKCDRAIRFVDPDQRTPESDAQVLIACFAADAAEEETASN